MTNPRPQITPEQVQQLRERLAQMAAMQQLPGGSAANARIYTIDEAMNIAESMAQALDTVDRIPVTATTTRNDDGTLTIHVKPQPQ